MSKTKSILLIVVGALLIGAFGSSRGQHLSAQESGSPTVEVSTPTPLPTPTPIPTPTAFALQRMAFNVLASMDIEIATDGPAYIRAATFTLGVGAASLPFQTEGPIVLLVQAGHLTIDSDNATISVPDVGFFVGMAPVTASPHPVEATVAGPGEQVYLPAGSTTTISNESLTENTTVMVVAVLPNNGTTPVP